MSLMSTAVARVKDSVRSWVGTWPMSEFGRVLGGGGGTSTGVPVDEFAALNYSALWAAVSIVSADLASLPLILYKRKQGGGKEAYTDAKLYELLHDAPNTEMTSIVFREALQAHVMTWGNGYAEIQRDDLGRPVAFWPITPDRVTPYREKGTRRLLYRVSNEDDGRPATIEPANMLHVPGLGFDGIQGYSVVHMARESISLGLATERFGGSFFGNGSTFGGILSTEQKLDGPAKQNIRESIDAVHAGVGRAHKFVILGGGMKYDKVGIPPNDAQFLETRKFQIAEISRWCGGIPLHKLSELDRATFSNIEQQDLEYYKGPLRRWAIRWEQEYQRKVISPLERKQQFIKHNAEAFLRGDSAARVAFYGGMFNIGAYTINKILDKEDENGIGPAGDVNFVQGNLMPAELLKDGPPKSPSPPPNDGADDLPPGDTKDDQRAQQIQDQIAKVDERIAEAAAAIAVIVDHDAQAEAIRTSHQQTIALLTTGREELQQQYDQYRSEQLARAGVLEAQLVEVTAQVKAEAEARTTAESNLEQARQETSAERIAREAAEQRAADAVTARAEAEIRFSAQVESAKAETVLERQAREAAETAKSQAEEEARAERDAKDAAETRAAAEAVARAKAEADLREGTGQAAADVEAARLKAEHAEAESRAAQSLAEEAERKRVDAERRREEALRHAEGVSAERTGLQQQAEVSAQAATVAAAQAEEARRQADAAAGKLAEAEAQRAATELSLVEAQEALRLQREVENARLAGMLTAHRSLIVDAMGRMVRRETEKARRHQATPQKLRSWADSFYVTHEDMCVEVLRPAVRAHLAWRQSAEDVDAVTLALVRSHVAESVTHIRAVADSDPDEMPVILERTLRKWEDTRPDALADRLLQDSVNQLRQLR